MIEFVAENREAFVVLGILLVVYVVANLIVYGTRAKRRKKSREIEKLYRDILGGD